MDFSRKTFKRETAAVFAAALFVVIGMAMRSSEALEVLRVIVYPFMTFIGLAFGLDVYAKRKRDGGG